MAEKKKQSIRERIKSKKTTLKREEIEVPEWGETVYLRALRLKDTEAAIALFGDEEATDFANGVRTLLFALEDEDGEKIFDPDDDFEWMMEQPAFVVNPLLGKLNELNGVNAGELEKNLPAAAASA